MDFWHLFHIWLITSKFSSWILIVMVAIGLVRSEFRKAANHNENFPVRFLHALAIPGVLLAAYILAGVVYLLPPRIG
jgi:hypothetical protein